MGTFDEASDVPPGTQESLEAEAYTDLFVDKLEQRFRELDTPIESVQGVNSQMLRYLPDVVKEIYDLATNSQSEKVRLEASKYLVDRVLGKAPQSVMFRQDQSNEAPWEEMFRKTVMEPSKRQLPELPAGPMGPPVPFD